MAVKRLPSGRYRVDYYSDGQRKRRSFDSKQLADIFNSSIRLKRDEQTLVVGLDLNTNKVELKPLIDSYFQHSKRHKKQRSYEDDLSNINMIYPYLVENYNVQFVSDLKPHQIEKFQDDRLTGKYPPNSKPISKRRINLNVQTLNAALNKAVRNREIKYNPLAQVSYFKTPQIFKRYFLPEELFDFFKQCNDEEFKIFYCLVATGMRSEELCHLQYRDIVKDGIMIRIKKDWAPKRDKERLIPINDDRIKQLIGKGGHLNYIFNSRDTRLNRHRNYKMFKRLIKKTEIKNPKEFNIHSFRHTFTTYMVASGKDLRTILETVGHSDYSTLLRYSHFVKFKVDKLPWKTYYKS